MKMPIHIDFNDDYRHIDIFYGLFTASWYDAVALTTIAGFGVYKRAGCKKQLFGIVYG